MDSLVLIDVQLTEDDLETNNSYLEAFAAISSFEPVQREGSITINTPEDFEIPSGFTLKVVVILE